VNDCVVTAGKSDRQKCWPYCFYCRILCQHDNSWTAVHSLMNFFARTRISTTSRSLSNIKLVGQRSRSHGFSCEWYCLNQLAWIHEMLFARWRQFPLGRPVADLVAKLHVGYTAGRHQVVDQPRTCHSTDQLQTCLCLDFYQVTYMHVHLHIIYVNVW